MSYKQEWAPSSSELAKGICVSLAHLSLFLGQASGVCLWGSEGLTVLSVCLSRWTICCPGMVIATPSA